MATYLKTLIAASQGADAAETWVNFVPTDEQVAVAMKAGRDLLDQFPMMPGACVMMSTVYALQLEELALPAYVVAGSLYVVGPRFVGDTRVFGENTRYDGRTVFSTSQSSWDGHAWVVLGDRLIDVSLFRTAYSRGSPPALAAHVKAEFGEGRGLMVCRIGTATQCGLRYEPEYVLTQEQVDQNARGAIAKTTGQIR